MRAVFLYGPPAAGKDTTTSALAALNRRYALYERLKVGDGRTEGYRIVDPGRLEAMRNARLLLWENRRYGAVYAVERTSLLEMFPDLIPVIHVGQSEAVDVISAALPQVHWSRIYLWCPRDVAAERLAARRMGDVDERLRAWDETTPLVDADLTFNTAVTSPTEVAQGIQRFINS